MARKIEYVKSEQYNIEIKIGLKDLLCPRCGHRMMMITKYAPGREYGEHYCQNCDQIWDIVKHELQKM